MQDDIRGRVGQEWREVGYGGRRTGIVDVANIRGEDRFVQPAMIYRDLVPQPVQPGDHMRPDKMRPAYDQDPHPRLTLEGEPDRYSR